MTAYFQDRCDAGHQLALRVQEIAFFDDVVVLALPRGGVPVADEVARALGAPLDVMLVRKLGAPRHQELAMGAIASAGVRVLNEDVIERLEISDAEIAIADDRERRELERREAMYRHDLPSIPMAHCTAVLVDDGMATGATMRAAARAARRLGATRVIVAVPVASVESVRRLREDADDIVALVTPADFRAVGSNYERFAEVHDDDVCSYLQESALRMSADAQSARP